MTNEHVVVGAFCFLFYYWAVNEYRWWSLNKACKYFVESVGDVKKCSEQKTEEEKERSKQKTESD